MGDQAFPAVGLLGFIFLLLLVAPSSSSINSPSVAMAKVKIPTVNMPTVSIPHVEGPTDGPASHDNLPTSGELGAMHASEDEEMMQEAFAYYVPHVGGPLDANQRQQHQPPMPVDAPPKVEIKDDVNHDDALIPLSMPKIPTDILG